jgi:feruloyl esterase
MKRFLLIIPALFAGCGYVWADPMPCGGLAKINLSNAEITATLVQPGSFTPPANPNGPPPQAPAGVQNPQQRAQSQLYKSLPAFCRVQATLHPTADSAIKMELWMPAEKWNGRLAETGNGGFSSNIGYNSLAQYVAKGYAGTGSNTGKGGNDAVPLIGHPEKVKDWGYRAVHETTVAAKAILAAYYGSGPKYSYWDSCSTGGRQGWVAAEYFPNDFDGLVIGDPANPMSRLQANNIYVNLALTKDEASYIPPPKWAMIHDKVLAQCDAIDGVKDGLIENPMVCNFDVNSLLCKEGDAADCLTAPQITALNVILTGSKNPRTGEQLYPGYPLGTAMAPGAIAGKNPDGSAVPTFRMLFQDANWDFHTFDFDKDTARADQLANNTINAVEPAKLKGVFDHGGKIILYHGWEDPAITPLIQVKLYQDAVQANGGLDKTYSEMRLFMAPGGFHCQGGEGPFTWDKLDAISDWVEKGKAPDSIVASHANSQGYVDRTRPLCPYPQQAKYKGTGNINDAENFVCAKP